MKKGVIPLLAILFVAFLVVITIIAFMLINMKLQLATHDTVSFFEITELKNAFNLTARSLEGGLMAISSEAVFHQFDTGLPDCRPSCYVTLNPLPTSTTTPTTTTIAGATTSSTTTTTVDCSRCSALPADQQGCSGKGDCPDGCPCNCPSDCLSGHCAVTQEGGTCFSIGGTTTTTVDPYIYETSYRKYPKSWVAETKTSSGKYNGSPSWTQGIMSYPDFTKESFDSYVKSGVKKFMEDHLATSFTSPMKVYMEYRFSDASLDPSYIYFNVGASMSMSSVESSIDKTDLGTYEFKYPLSTSSMFNEYLIGRQVITGFNPQLSFHDSGKDFNTFISGVMNSFQLPSGNLGKDEKKTLEDSLKQAMSQKLDDYASAISSEKNISAAFMKDGTVFDNSMYTGLNVQYRKKYDAYLANYTILANISNPADQAFCCNWNPIANISSRQSPGLYFLLNDTFLSLACDDRHKTAIWYEHRDDNKNMLCEATSSYNWVDFYTLQGAMGKKDILLDLDHNNAYESFWDSNTTQWYRCGYSLGDVNRIDIIDDVSKGILDGSIDPEEQIIGMNIYPLGREFQGTYDNTAPKSDQGSLVCSIQGKTLVKSSKADSGTDKGNQFLRCFDNVQDFRILSVATNYFGGQTDFTDKYCCINSVHKDNTDNHTCSVDDQRNDQYCCECFGNTWVGSGRHNGYCIGDGWCERSKGESAADSSDCCQKTGDYSFVDSGDFSYTARLNPGTQSDVTSWSTKTTDNKCYDSCVSGTKVENNPTCSGKDENGNFMLTDCNGNAVNCGKPIKTCENPVFSPSGTMDFCSEKSISYGCGPTHIPGASGDECFTYMNDAQRCGVGRPCDYDPAYGGYCNNNRCSMACGAQCETGIDGKVSGCDDICGSDTLLLSRSCSAESCSCVSGTPFKCDQNTPMGEKEKTCNNQKYQCMVVGGAYSWVRIPSA